MKQLYLNKIMVLGILKYFQVSLSCQVHSNSLTFISSTAMLGQYSLSCMIKVEESNVTPYIIIPTTAT